ncbi:unnamed protein product, partial [marine sediment metagenome]
MSKCKHTYTDRLKAISLEELCPLCQTERIAKLEAAIEAIEAIWPFLEDDFPKGTGDDHGTCATKEYLD